MLLVVMRGGKEDESHGQIAALHLRGTNTGATKKVPAIEKKRYGDCVIFEEYLQEYLENKHSSRRAVIVLVQYLRTEGNWQSRSKKRYRNRPSLRERCCQTIRAVTEEEACEGEDTGTRETFRARSEI